MGLRLAQIFADGMVLQRELPVHVWGTATSGASVEVEIQGKRALGVADEQGAWCVTLDPLAASEEETLVVTCGDERLELRDVAVGEVWVAGGQSNMEFWMRYDRDVEAARATCANSRIRFYDTPKCSYPGQQDDFDYSKVGIWRKATPEDLDYFSAVGYYCARMLEAELDVPVGIVGCNYGGTLSSAWMPADHAREVQPEQAAGFDAKLQGLPYEELLANGKLNADKNNKGYATWPAWNEFFLPKTHTDDEIRAFFAEQAQKGSGPADVGGLEIGAGQEGKTKDVHPGLMTPTKEAPGSLFTYMVLPIAGFAARGVLWYQGESDDEFAGSQWRHELALRTLIADWRAAWGDEALAFLVVQIPDFGTWMGMGPNDYSAIRASQQRAVDATERAWLCSIGDVGDEFDIHPKVKQPVGERLALLALAHLYGRDVLADAPRMAGAVREGRTLTLTFDHAGEGLVVEGDVVNALEVTADGKPVGFQATAKGPILILVLDAEPQGSVVIRYCQTNWYRANLYNSAHIPALPFTTSC